ncbi:SRPBCC family protein [Phenylobacterium sp.]|uniref:SRPBCC family protein n=1 Tax=Phenylobacterium sp. TaxID=1871053 RepID=UPI003BACAEEB
MNIDVPAMIGAVVREVAVREQDGRPARAVIATRAYDTTVDDLWEAITNPERIPRWFLPVTGELKLGGRYQLQGNAGGTITACEPPRRLSLTWEFAGQTSWVNVALSEAGDGAQLELEHVAHVDNDHWKQFGPGAVGIGWELSLIGLALHLEGGAQVDPDGFAAWSASPDGRALMAASGTAWGEAHAASGEDAETARASAARTVAFYTGEA